MRIIQLHKILPTRRPDSIDQGYSDSDDPTENAAQVVELHPAPETAPVAVNADSIRCFYPRNADRGPGTRITFKDGGGFAVAELYDEVLALVQ